MSAEGEEGGRSRHSAQIAAAEGNRWLRQRFTLVFRQLQGPLFLIFTYFDFPPDYYAFKPHLSAAKRNHWSTKAIEMIQKIQAVVEGEASISDRSIDKIDDSIKVRINCLRNLTNRLSGSAH